MIGISALLLGLGFVIFPLVEGFFVFLDWRSDKRPRNLFGLVFFALFFLLSTNRVAHNVWCVYGLRTLSAAEVSAVEVNGRAVTDPKAVAEIVAALHDV